ncbi:hypothetical protein [uncultured Paracoccus sp.]|uniref:hypothetical protein n=1 Tax=uncultured Paracoccus sp. TaxID=189685 RepID=UPI002612D010|nr:hypothetical protein [uncultured Paracoccus sp.]
MNIIELAGIAPNSPAPRNVISESDRQIARIPDHADGRRIGRYWWQADRGFLRPHPDTGRAVWYDRMAPGARLVSTGDTWPVRGAEFTATAGAGGGAQGSYAVSGNVRMHAPDVQLDAQSNTVYFAMRPVAGASALLRLFGPQAAIPGADPRDDVLAFGLLDGSPRLLSDDTAVSILVGGASADYRNQNVVIRIAKSTTWGASIAVNGVEVARDASKVTPLIDRSIALFGVGAAPAVAQFHGAIRHLMVFTGADFSADPFFGASDAVVTARLKADIGVV